MFADVMDQKKGKKERKKISENSTFVQHCGWPMTWCEFTFTRALATNNKTAKIWLERVCWWRFRRQLKANLAEIRCSQSLSCAHTKQHSAEKCWISTFNFVLFFFVVVVSFLRRSLRPWVISLIIMEQVLGEPWKSFLFIVKINKFLQIRWPTQQLSRTGHNQRAARDGKK